MDENLIAEKIFKKDGTMVIQKKPDNIIDFENEED